MVVMATEVILHIIGALQDIGLRQPSARAAREESAVGRIPGWVREIGVLSENGCYWIACNPAIDTGSPAEGQISLTVPNGRYLVDGFDPARQACVSRESAAGSPLVVGLPFTGNLVLLWIRPAPRH
jgi:hypothetical protein